MIIYTLIITKDGETIFSHDIALSPDQPFSKDVSEAFEVFRMNFKETRACHQLGDSRRRICVIHRRLAESEGPTNGASSRPTG